MVQAGAFLDPEAITRLPFKLIVLVDPVTVDPTLTNVVELDRPPVPILIAFVLPANVPAAAIFAV